MLKRRFSKYLLSDYGLDWFHTELISGGEITHNTEKHVTYVYFDDKEWNHLVVKVCERNSLNDVKSLSEMPEFITRLVSIKPLFEPDIERLYEFLLDKKHIFTLHDGTKLVNDVKPKE